MKGSAFWRWLRQMDIGGHSASAGFFMVLSAFPALVLAVGMLRYTKLEPLDLQIFLEGFLPEVLYDLVWLLVSAGYENSSRLVLSVSAVTALWSAGRGLYGLLRGLNAVYGVQEDRSWLRIRLMCMGYTLLSLLVLLTALALRVLGGFRLEGMGAELEFLLMTAAQTLLLCSVYMFLPRGGNGFLESLPGALAASLGWSGASWGFSAYVELAGGYRQVFGTVYVPVLAMVWLYLVVAMVFCGGIFNRLWSKNVDFV